jgi:hypothetical protein
MKLLITNNGLHLSIRIEVNLPRWLARFRRRPKRIPGLHAGAYQVSNDFDDYLPEDFLITDA